MLLTQYRLTAKHNLFAYSNNSPVVSFDSDGKGIGIGLLIVCLGAGALLLNGCSAKNKNTAVNKTKYNCYAHALRKTKWQHVGDSSKTAIAKISDVEEVANVVLLDNANRGIRRLSSIWDVTEDSEYLIALRTGCAILNNEVIEDYHFMRQEKMGRGLINKENMILSILAKV